MYGHSPTHRWERPATRERLVTLTVPRFLIGMLVLGSCLPGCGGAIVPPDPGAFVGTWSCETSTAASDESQSLYIELRPNIRAGVTGLTVLFLSGQVSGQSICYTPFTVVSETADSLPTCDQLLSLPLSPSSDPNEPSCASSTTCGTLTVHGNTLQGSLTLRNNSSGATTAETLSCRLDGDAGVAAATGG